MNIKRTHIFKLTTLIIALAFSALIVYPVIYSGFALAAKPGHIPATVRLITREVSLGKLQPGEVEYSRVISSDQKHIAYTVKTNDGEFVMVDGVAGKTYTSIPRVVLTEAGIKQQIEFSPDGRRVAYVAGRGKKFLVVVDGKEGPEYDRIGVGAPSFSPDSRRLAYFAERGGKTFAVVDGIEGKPFDHASSSAPIFSPDSRRVVYMARHGKQTHVVIDGVEVVEPEYAGDPEFSKSGKRMAYVVVRKDQWRVVTDGKEGKPYRGLGNNIEFSDDEKHVLYRADTPEGQMIVVDGVEPQPRPVIEENSYGFSPDGRRVAYIARESRDEQYVVVDNKNGKTYEDVGKPTFSPDSGHVIYEAWRAGKMMVVTDGVEGEAFDEVNDYFRFSPDGKRMVYLAKRGGRQFLVVDGVATAYDEITDFKFSPDSKRLFVKARRGNVMLMTLEGEPPKQYELTPPKQGEAYEGYHFEMTFSPDSKRTAYVLRRGGKDYVILDGSEGKPYDEIEDLQFTADARHLVYAARRDGKLVVVVDGIESKEYDDFVSGASLVLDGARTIGMMVTRDQEILRVEIEIAE
jgi:Tol biopolymer transport system component